MANVVLGGFPRARTLVQAGVICLVAWHAFERRGVVDLIALFVAGGVARGLFEKGAWRK